MPIIYQEYEKLKFLGKGAFAKIYKVRHKDLGYVRAIKVLIDEVKEDGEDKVYKTFLKECSLLLRLGNGGHPNIIRIYQPRKIEGNALVEMDYIDGVTFESYVSEKKFIPIEEIYRFIKEIGSALAYCHVDCYRSLMNHEEKDKPVDELIQTYGVAHNDIHSNNIMKKSLDGSYVLLDFGLAIQDGKAVKSSSRGDGAAEYIPPEKWSGEKIANEKAVDVYGFGILLYQMLAGQVPFVLDPEEYQKDSLKTLNTLRARHEMEKPAEILPLRNAAYKIVTGKDDFEKDYPDWLEKLIFKCLEKDPANRFHDAKELLEFFSRNYQGEANSVKLLATLQKSNKALKQKISNLEEQLDEASRNADLKSDKRFNDVCGQLRKVQDELFVAGHELEKTSSINKEIEKALKDKDKELSSLKTGIKVIPKVNKFLIVLTTILAVVLTISSIQHYKSNDSSDYLTSGDVFVDSTVYQASSNIKDDREDVQRLERLIKQKDIEIAKKNETISSLQKQIKQNSSTSNNPDNNQSGLVEEQRQTIQSLTTERDSFKKQVSTQQQKVEELRKQVKSLTAERDKYKEQVRNLINNSL